MVIPGVHDVSERAGNMPIFRADCELAQVSTIINVLGSYQPELWGGSDLLPDYGKILLADSDGIPLTELFADSTPAAIDVLAALLSCAPLWWLSSAAQPCIISPHIACK
jgi:hypothetical protein